MLRTLFTLLFISSIVVSAKADAYSHGFMTAVIINSFRSNSRCENKASIETKYNLITMDTSLLDFPKTNSPQCYYEKVEVKSYIIFQWYHRLMGSFLVSLMLYPFVYTLFYGTNEERRFIVGMHVGHIISRSIRRRRHC